MKRPRTPRQQAWAASARFREIGRASLRKLARKRALLPKCGATARTTREPCQQPAMENGRCRYHGGLTPSGSGWHRPVWPDRNSPVANEKLGRKLDRLQRAARKRETLLREMSPEERAAHEAWQRTHKPGSPAARGMLRMELRDAASFQDRSDKPEPPRSPELLALDRDIALLREAIEKERREQDASSNDDMGVLG